MNPQGDSSSFAFAKSHGLFGQTNSVPRFLVVLIIKIGQAHLGQVSLTGSFQSAYLQSGYFEQE